MNIEMKAMELIVTSGESRSLSFEALQAANKGEYAGAEAKLKEAKNQALKAHKIQTELITKESSGEDIKVGLLMVHAQDHLMTSMLANDLISEMLKLHKKIDDN